MHKVFAILGLVCALPVFVNAQAGFPEKPLWLSNTKPISGEEVFLYTVLYNGTDATSDGTLIFFVDKAQLKTETVSLAAQSSSVVSAKWTAISGTHSFNARFETASSTASTLPQQTVAIQVTVAEPPPPSALQQNVHKAAEVAGQFVSSSAPFVQKVAQAVFTQTEALRNAGIKYLEKKVESPESKKTTSGSTLHATGFGSSTSAETSGSLLHNAAQTALAAVLFTLRSFYLFYPILAFVFLGSLYWAAGKILRRRTYEPP